MRLRKLSAAVIGLGAAMLLAGMLAGCGEASVSTMEPQVDAVTVESSSSLSEESQQVVITIPFKADVADVGDVKVTVDGKEADSKAVESSVQTQGPNLVVTLRPGTAAGTTSTGTYFALYQGQVEVSGGVLASPVNVVVPSGMKIKTVSQSAGKTVVEVTQPAQIRCCTWFELGDEKLFIHHHEFARETCESCASSFAEQINTAFPDEYSAKSKGSRVTISTADDDDFDVSVLEGAGVSVQS